MRIIVVDDDQMVLSNLTHCLSNVAPQAEIIGFTQPQQAIAHLKHTPADVAFFAIELSPINGLNLAKLVSEIYPRLNIIFLATHPNYAIAAFSLFASGYVMKPVHERELRAVLDNLRYPLPPCGQDDVRLQTFGSFEVFYQGAPLHFPRKRCKECLAYLVDRNGASVSPRELAAVLWEGQEYDRQLQNNLQTIVSDLMRTLKQIGAQDMIIKQYNSIAVDPSRVECDYFRLISATERRRNTFHGQYMSQYSWAQPTLDSLQQLCCAQFQ